MSVSRGLYRQLKEVGLSGGALNELIEHLENRHVTIPPKPAAKPAAAVPTPIIEKAPPKPTPVESTKKTTKKKGPAKVD